MGNWWNGKSEWCGGLIAAAIERARARTGQLRESAHHATQRDAPTFGEWLNGQRLNKETMTRLRSQCIYHMTHIGNLWSIYNEKFIWSDSEVRERELRYDDIGNPRIKDRRLNTKLIHSHQHMTVGEFVPFYFRVRSPMLYSKRCQQKDIVYIVARLYDAIEYSWRDKTEWAFTKSNAGCKDIEDFKDLRQLGEIDWDAVSTNLPWKVGIANHKAWLATRQSAWDKVLKGGQAEFLFHRGFPVSLIQQLVFPSHAAQEKAAGCVPAIRGKSHTRPDWYFLRQANHDLAYPR
jgi:hypothetical protein